MKTCPYCAEEISSSALVCPYCNTEFDDGGSGDQASESYAQHAPPERASRRSLSVRPRKSSNTTVIVLVVVGSVVVLGFCGVALLLPAVNSAREAARRLQCKNNLKLIGLALQSYHAVHNSYPPAVVVDEQGRPLYSWRVLLLPFLEDDGLYNQLDLSKSWDDPANRRLLERMPQVYGCPSHPDGQGNTTSYFGVFGPNCVFQGEKSTRSDDITDGTWNTIMVGEATGVRIHWAKPGDIDIDLHTDLSDPDGFMGPHQNRCHFLFADGTVRFIENTIDPDTLRSLFKINDGR